MASPTGEEPIAVDDAIGGHPEHDDPLTADAEREDSGSIEEERMHKDGEQEPGDVGNAATDEPENAESADESADSANSSGADDVVDGASGGAAADDADDAEEQRATEVEEADTALEVDGARAQDNSNARESGDPNANGDGDLVQGSVGNSSVGDEDGPTMEETPDDDAVDSGIVADVVDEGGEAAGNAEAELLEQGSEDSAARDAVDVLTPSVIENKDADEEDAAGEESNSTGESRVDDAGDGEDKEEGLEARVDSDTGSENGAVLENGTPGGDQEADKEKMNGALGDSNEVSGTQHSATEEAAEQSEDSVVDVAEQKVVADDREYRDVAEQKVVADDVATEEAAEQSEDSVVDVAEQKVVADDVATEEAAEQSEDSVVDVAEQNVVADDVAGGENGDQDAEVDRDHEESPNDLLRESNIENQDAASGENASGTGEESLESNVIVNSAENGHVEDDASDEKVVPPREDSPAGGNVEGDGEDTNGDISEDELPPMALLSPGEMQDKKANKLRTSAERGTFFGTYKPEEVMTRRNQAVIAATPVSEVVMEPSHSSKVDSSDEKQAAELKEAMRVLAANLPSDPDAIQTLLRSGGDSAAVVDRLVRALGATETPAPPPYSSAPSANAKIPVTSETLLPNTEVSDRPRQPTLQEVLSLYSRGLRQMFQFYSKAHFGAGKSPSFDKLGEDATSINFAEFYSMCRDFHLNEIKGLGRKVLREIFRSCADRRISVKELNRGQFVDCLIKISDVVLSRPPLNQRYPSKAEKVRALFHRLDLADERRRFLMKRMKGFGAFQAGDGVLRGHQGDIPNSAREGGSLDFDVSAPRTAYGSQRRRNGEGANAAKRKKRTRPNGTAGKAYSRPWAEPPSSLTKRVVGGDDNDTSAQGKPGESKTSTPLALEASKPPENMFSLSNEEENELLRDFGLGQDPSDDNRASSDVTSSAVSPSSTDAASKTRVKKESKPTLTWDDLDSMAFEFEDGAEDPTFEDAVYTGYTSVPGAPGVQSESVGRVDPKQAGGVTRLNRGYEESHKPNEVIATNGSPMVPLSQRDRGPISNSGHSPLLPAVHESARRAVEVGPSPGRGNPRPAPQRGNAARGLHQRRIRGHGRLMPTPPQQRSSKRIGGRTFNVGRTSGSEAYLSSSGATYLSTSGSEAPSNDGFAQYSH